MKTTVKGFRFGTGYQGKQKQATFFYGRKATNSFRALPVGLAS